MAKPQKTDRRALRELAIALALGVVGALGAIGIGKLGSDPLAMLTWFALIALPCGAVGAALELRFAPYALVAPGTWMLELVLFTTDSKRVLPTPLWAALVWSGLFALGFASAAWLERSRWSSAAAMLCLSATLVALPGKAGLAREPWPPAMASAALDVSPAALVCESAGLANWMWQRGNYSQVGVDRFAREPWRGRIIGPILLGVGVILALAAERRGRTRRAS